MNGLTPAISSLLDKDLLVKNYNFVKSLTDEEETSEEEKDFQIRRCFMQREELGKIIKLDDRIESKIRQLEQLRLTKEGVSGIDYSEVKASSGIGNQVENTVIKILEYEKEIQEDIEKLIDMKARAREDINKVEGINGTVLEMRYLEGMRWEEIAYRLNYGIRHIHRLHGQALKDMGSVKCEEGYCEDKGICNEAR